MSLVSGKICMGGTLSARLGEGVGHVGPIEVDGEKILFGFCAALIAVAWMGVSGVLLATAEDICNDVYAAPPLGPERPGSLIAFRNPVAGTMDEQDISLHWVNKADNASCFAVEAKLSSALEPASDGQWAFLDTIHDPKINQHLHRVTYSGPGEICYRVYASNSWGKSDYSNRVCLQLEALDSSGTASAEAGSSAPGSGVSTWLVLAIALPLAGCG